MSTTLKQANPCPDCGGPLPSGALAGLCPACLLAQGFPTDAGGPEKPGRFEAPPLERIAALFPRLEVVAMVGTGGMGAVYKARQPSLDRWVALKVLPADGPGGALSEERFNREARALARLSHPNIVGVHEFGQIGGLHYFIMEFVDGADLRQLGQAGRLSPREALQIIPQICDALQYAHDEGVVHRDIKPENVLVDRKGRVKIADFGLAKLTGQDPESHRLTVDGQVMGTPHYMAPEQVERPLSVDHRADIYSLGVVFYELLTGDLPLGKFLPPSRKVQVDVRLDDIVLRALENDPARRYQHASEVKSGVETVTNSPGPATAVSSPVHREEPPPATGRATTSWWHAITPALAGFAIWLLVMVTTAFVTATLPQWFGATARVKVDAKVAEAGDAHLLRPDPLYFATVFEVLRSHTVLERAADRLKLQEKWAGRSATGQLSLREAGDLLRPMVEVRQFRNTAILEVTTWSGSAIEAAELANAVAAAFVDQTHLQKVGVAAHAGVVPTTRIEAEVIDSAQPPLHPSRPNVPLNLFLGLVVGGVSGGAAALLVGFLRRRAGIAASAMEQRRSRLVVGAAVVLVAGVPFVVMLDDIRTAGQAERQWAFAVEKANTLATAQKAESTNSPARSADTLVTILTPDGRPATGAEVAMVRSGEFATLVGERFSDADLHDGRRVQTYDDGRFRLSLDDRLDRIFAVHASGFAEAKPGQLAGQTHWALQPWGRIEGRWTSGDQPVVGRDLAVEPLEESEAGPLRFGGLAFKTETDHDGRFRFEHVTPGRVKLTRFLRTDRGNGNVSWPPGRSTEVDVRQGEVTTVALDVSGHRLTGRLVWPAGPRLAPHWRFMGHAHTPIPGPPAGIGGDPVAFERWRKSPAQQKLIKAAKQFNLAVLPDDTLYAEDLEPGTYRLDFLATVDWTTEADGHLKAEATADPITITVPAEPATGTIDIGVVTLRLVPPRPR